MHIRHTSTLATVALLLAASLAAFPAVAEPAGSDQWQFEVTPYLFASGLKGTVGARGVAAQTDLSFNDIFSNLDAAALALFEARKGRWTFGVDAIYMKLSDGANKSFQGPLGFSNNIALELKMKQQLYQPFVGYRVFDEHTKVDLIAGARYTKLDAKATLTLTTGLALLPDGSRSVSGSESWWDPIIGVRVQTPIADKWSFVGYADVGVGGESDSTYQLAAGINWQYAKQFSAKFGYRYLAQDYKKDGFVWDVKMSGPYIGLGIAF